MELCFWGGEGKPVKIFWPQKKVIQLLTGVHKRVSCRHIFREFQILTLASLYILEVLCFIKKYQGNLQQNFAVHGHYTRNKFDLHTATAVLFCIREVWQTGTLNCLINYQYKSNNWTSITVLREKWKIFSYVMHFIQLKKFCTLREFSIAHCVGTIITNGTCVHIVCFCSAITVWLMYDCVQDLTVPMYMGLKWWGPLCPISIQGSPVTLLQFQMSPRLIRLRPSGSKKEPRYTCLSEAKVSHSQRMWAEVSSSAPRLLHSGLSDSPIRWRCLLRVLCPVRRPVTRLDCVLLKDRNLTLAPRQGHEIRSPACLAVTV